MANEDETPKTELTQPSDDDAPHKNQQITELIMKASTASSGYQWIK